MTASTWENHENNSVDLVSHVKQTVNLRGVVSHEKIHNLRKTPRGRRAIPASPCAKPSTDHLKPTAIEKVSGSCRQ
jgi:hypothetical protein